MELFIILGIVLLILAIIFAIPGLGVGLILPVIGDIIDIPLAFFFAVTGVIFLLIGGVITLVTNYWWALLLGLIIYIFLISGKTWKIYTKKGRRVR